MSTSNPPMLTPRDFSLLQKMIEDCNRPASGKLVMEIRKKLATSRVVFAEDMAGNIVTIGSRVTFSVDSGPVQERRLVTPDHYVPGQQHQSIASLRGLSLLGIAVGSRTQIDHGTHTEWLEVHNLPYQPETAVRTRQQRSRSEPSSNSRPIGAPYMEDDPNLSR